MELVVLRVYPIGKDVGRLEVALGHSGEYPRVMFRAGIVIPSLYHSAATLRDLLEELGEELFNVAAYADRAALTDGPGASGEDLESSVQLTFPDTLDGGGRGGPAGE